MNYAEKKHEGVCVRHGCAKRASKGVLCEAHRKQSKANGSLRRAARKQDGICKDCGRLALNGKTLCQRCAKKSNDCQNRRTAEHRAKGLCASCSNPASVWSALCFDCQWRRFPQYTRRAAASRGIPITTSDTTLYRIVAKLCHYCGSMDQRGFNGIDCKVFNRGYVRGNMLPCCWMCNAAKRDVPYETFVEWLRKCAENLGFGL